MHRLLIINMIVLSKPFLSIYRKDYLLKYLTRSRECVKFEAASTKYMFVI